MSSRGSGGGDALILLILVVVGFVFFGIFYLGYKILKWMYDHPEETKAAIVFVLRVAWLSIWLPHVAVAWAILYIFRDVPVLYMTGETEDPPSHQKMVFFWWVILPIIAAIGWLLLWAGLGQVGVDIGVALLLGVISTGLLLPAYFHVYFEKPPMQHGVPYYKWVWFIAAEHLLRFNLRLKWIEFTGGR